MRVYLLFFLTLFFAAYLLRNTISGVVTDSNSQPIPGANIQGSWSLQEPQVM
jgi:hypothetical protein